MNHLNSTIITLCVTLVTSHAVAQHPPSIYIDPNVNLGTFVVRQINKTNILNGKAELVARLFILNCRQITGKYTVEVLFVNEKGFKPTDSTIVLQLNPGIHRISAGNSVINGLYPVNPVNLKFRANHRYSIDFYLPYKPPDH